MTSYRCCTANSGYCEWIEAKTPAHAAQEFHCRISSRYDPHVLIADDGTLTIYGVVQVEGDGEWICRTYYRPLKRKGGVKGPAKPRRELADIEKAMGLSPGRLAGPWELEEEDWR